MATVSLNDLKIRLLQLKGIGYDKLLLQKSLSNQLEVLGQELIAISNEITSLTKMILDTNAAVQLEQEEKQLNEQRTNNDQQPMSHLTVDPNQLSNILSPNTTLGKTDIEKNKKTEHIIGRRTNG